MLKDETLPDYRKIRLKTKLHNHKVILKIAEHKVGSEPHLNLIYSPDRLHDEHQKRVSVLLPLILDQRAEN